ncbi:hypothetical protein HYS48_02970, partial [Candidatus Woesearchaeota archaeon]|nr:hypothetical protein [Candidatus Woesearchaeota archaeon]
MDTAAEILRRQAEAKVKLQAVAGIVSGILLLLVGGFQLFMGLRFGGITRNLFSVISIVTLLLGILFILYVATGLHRKWVYW